MQEKKIAQLLILGNLLFAAGIAYIYFTLPIKEVTDQARDDALTMTIFNGGFFIFAALITTLIERAKKTSGKNQELVPLILWETSGFLGLTVIMMSVNTSVVHEQQWLWLNGLTGVLFFIIAIRFMAEKQHQNPVQNT